MLVQDKLQALAGQHTDVLENLEPKVRRRVEVLQEIQVILKSRTSLTSQKGRV